MKTTLDLVDIIWSAVNASALKAAINGGVYKHKRVLNSTKEDVVINALPITAEQIQNGIVNVNIHVPNLKVQTAAGVDDQPNHTRLKALATIAVGVLEDTWADEYNFDVQQQILIEDKEANDYYINIRLEFFNVNISN
jgi:hypothetical protein